jgi:AsmA protein
VLLVDPNAYRNRLQDMVRERTGRELVLQGDIRLSVFPWLAVELGPATLGNAPGFGKEPMLAIRHARLGLKVWPLLHGRIEVGSVRLDGPAARLEVDAQGRDNWSDLLQSRATVAEAGPKALKGSIAGLVVEDGSLVYVDRQAGTTRKIGQLRLRTGRLEPGQPFRLELQTVAEPEPKSPIEVKLDARARVDLAQHRFEFEAPTLSLRFMGASWPKAGLPAGRSRPPARACTASCRARRSSMRRESPARSRSPTWRRARCSASSASKRRRRATPRCCSACALTATSMRPPRQ